jgi:hypothetical protein
MRNKERRLEIVRFQLSDVNFLKKNNWNSLEEVYVSNNLLVNIDIF